MTTLASIRISPNIRDSIISNAVDKAGINKKLNAILERKVDLAEKLRIVAMGGDEKFSTILRQIEETLALFKHLNSVTNGIVNYTDPFRRGSYIVVAFGGMKDNINFSGHNGEHISYCRIDAKFKQEVYKYRPYELLLPGDHPLTIQWTHINNDYYDLMEEKGRIIQGVRVALSSINTTKQLAERWPEALELLPADISPVGRNLPAIRTEELNALIGLPSAEETGEVHDS